jgi:hypothetical protein
MLPHVEHEHRHRVDRVTHVVQLDPMVVETLVARLVRADDPADAARVRKLQTVGLPLLETAERTRAAAAIAPWSGSGSSCDPASDSKNDSCITIPFHSNANRGELRAEDSFLPASDFRRRRIILREQLVNCLYIAAVQLEMQLDGGADNPCR